VVKAPVAVRSVQAPVRVAVKPKVVVVPKAVQPPAPAPTQANVNGNDPAYAGRYYNGTPVKKDVNGNVIVLPKVVPPYNDNAPTSDGHGVPIPTPTP